MSNHNKIRPVDKNNPSGKYKILFSTPQTKNSNIPMEFRGLQIYNNKSLAEENNQHYYWVYYYKNDAVKIIGKSSVKPQCYRQIARYKK